MGNTPAAKTGKKEGGWITTGTKTVNDEIDSPRARGGRGKERKGVRVPTSVRDGIRKKNREQTAAMACNAVGNDPRFSRKKQLRSIAGKECCGGRRGAGGLGRRGESSQPPNPLGWAKNKNRVAPEPRATKRGDGELGG